MATPIPQNAATFSVSELVTATSGRLLSSGASEVRGVATDSREDLRAKLFVALSGERFDGHAFLARAIEAGALAFVVERWPEELPLEGLSIILVPDTLRALGDLALAFRLRWGGRVIAIGGSAGKTTSKNVVARLLEALAPGEVAKTRGNLNNRIGVPMTLLSLEPSQRWAVLELGTNQRGEMAELARIVRADLALLTLIDLEHAEGLGGLDGVEEEEAALFRALARDGIAVGNGHDERVRRQLERVPGRKLAYALEAGEDFAFLEERRLGSDGKSLLSLRLAGRPLEIDTDLLGQAGALAVLAGLCVAEALFPGRLDGATASVALAGAGEPGRSSLLVLARGILVLDDTYNSNPASVQSSIKTGVELARQSGGRLWLVLGAMLELGTFSSEAHAEMGRAAALSGAAGLWGVSGDALVSVQEAERAGLAAHFVADASEVASALVPQLEPGDVVVVKASRGVRAERVVADLLLRIGSPPPSSATSPERASAARLSTDETT